MFEHEHKHRIRGLLQVGIHLDDLRCPQNGHSVENNRRTGSTPLKLATVSTLSLETMSRFSPLSEGLPRLRTIHGLFLMPILRAIFLLSLVSSSFSLSAAIMPPGRTVDWSDTGIEGGIPLRTNIFCNVRQLIPGTNIVATGDGVADDRPAIQAAINLCPPNQVVYLPAGIYKLGAALVVSCYTKAITLRGAGPGQTIVDGAINLIGNTTAVDRHPVTLGATLGSTNIIIGRSQVDNSWPEAMRVGWILLFESSGDPAFVQPQGYEGGVWNPRPQGQLIEVVGFGTGRTNLTFRPPLYWDAGTNVVVHRIYGNASYPNFVRLIGLEDFRLHHNNALGNYAVRLERVDRCWMSNVEVTNSKVAGVLLTSGYRCELFGNYIHHSTMSGSGGGYGILMQGKSTQCRVENNILDELAGTLLVDDGSAGNVIAYNYSHGIQFYTMGWQGTHFGTHSSHPMFNLFEGNVGPNHLSDFIHGSSSHATLYRNRLLGWGLDTVYARQNFAVMFDAYNRHANFVGNVLGTPRAAAYEMERQYDFATSAIWVFGYNGGRTYDPDAKATAWRHMNYDTLTATNGGVRWATNDTTLPDSLYLATKPSWFSNVVWPPIHPVGPVTNSIPAQLRFAGVNYSTGSSQPPDSSRSLKPLAAVCAIIPSSGQGPAPLTVRFDTQAPAGATFLYDFGDGATTTTANPVHIYTAPGQYTARIVVTCEGQSITLTKQIRVTAPN